MWLLIVRNSLLTGNYMPSIRGLPSAWSGRKNVLVRHCFFILVHYWNLFFFFGCCDFLFSAACVLIVGLLDIPCLFMVFSSWKPGLDHFNILNFNYVIVRFFIKPVQVSKTFTLQMYHWFSKMNYYCSLQLLPLSLSLSIYIYIYTCAYTYIYVCVCVCIYVMTKSRLNYKSDVCIRLCQEDQYLLQM